MAGGTADIEVKEKGWAWGRNGEFVPHAVTVWRADAPDATVNTSV